MRKKKDLVTHYLKMRGVDSRLQSLSESGREIMLDYIPRMSDEAWADLSHRIFEKMWDMYVEKFTDSFSSSEMEEIVKFFRSRAGRLLIRQEKRIGKDVETEIRPFVKDYLEDILAIIDVQDEILN